MQPEDEEITYIGHGVTLLLTSHQTAGVDNVRNILCDASGQEVYE